MDKNEYIIQQLALLKAQLEIDYLELKYENEQLKLEIQKLKGSDDNSNE